MYKLTIETKYNTIILERDNLDDPELIEILEQPYIINVNIEEQGKQYVRKQSTKGNNSIPNKE